MADGKAPGFLWSDTAGNVASALLALVLGWILGQLKWDHMLMTGVGTAAVLLVFLGCRYVYALRHPGARPLTIDDLRALRRDLDGGPHLLRIGGSPSGDDVVPEVGERALLHSLVDGDEPESEEAQTPVPSVRQWLSLGTYNPELSSQWQVLDLASPASRSGRWAAVRQMLGVG